MLEVVIDEKNRVGVFLNKKKITPPQYVLDQAKIFADMEGDIQGFSRSNPGSKSDGAWLRAFKNYIREAYQHSFLPAEKNPTTEKVTRRIVEKFDFFFGPLGFFTAYAKDNTELLQNLSHQFKSSVVSLAQLFMRLEIGLKLKARDGELSDFEFPPFNDARYKSEEAKEKKKKEVEINRYKRLFFMVMTMQSLIPIFSMKKDEFENFIKGFELDKYESKELAKEKSRTVFAKAIMIAATKVFAKKNILTELASVLPAALQEAKVIYDQSEKENKKVSL